MCSEAFKADINKRQHTKTTEDEDVDILEKCSYSK